MDAPQWPKVSLHGFHKEMGMINLAEGSYDVVASNSSSSHLKQEKSKKTRPNKDRALNCPRCNSTKTKFCYYNNYNLSQPRHLCKACRRYWTHGGTLRNVPVGGTSRKKINKPSLAPNFPSSHSRLFLDLNPKPTTTLNQDLNMGLYYANAHYHFLPNPSVFELCPSQGALSPYHNASMSSLGFNFQDTVNPTLNLSMDGGLGRTNHEKRNMEDGGRNPYLFGEVKKASATPVEENVIIQNNGQKRESSENGAVYWNQMHHGLYN